MFPFENRNKSFRVWARGEIARQTRETMLTYQAARHSLDVYEMRLEAIDARLGKRVRELEGRVMELEAALALREDGPVIRPDRLAG